MTIMGIQWEQLQEQKRSNRANEAHNAAKLAEESRHNIVFEGETHRSNLAREFENNRANLAKEEENRRSNLAKEAETNRHNLVDEKSNTALRNAQTVKALADAGKASGETELLVFNANTNRIAANAKKTEAGVKVAKEAREATTAIYDRISKVADAIIPG